MEKADLNPSLGVQRLRGPHLITPSQSVRLEGFEPSTLDCVNRCPNPLGDSRNISS